ICLVIGGVVAVGYILIYTSQGSQQIAEQVISRYSQEGDIRFDAEGSIGRGLTMKDIELNDLKGFPRGSRLRIQRLYIDIASLDLDGLVVEVEHARLQLPDAEPIIVTGTFKNQILDLDIFSRGFTVNEVLTYLPDLKGMIPLKGEVDAVDLYVKGHYRAPQVTGTFRIRRFIYRGAVLTDSFCSIDTMIKDAEKDLKIFGKVSLEKGILQTGKVFVDMESGRIRFSGPWNDPEIEFLGNALVERTKIKIALNGTVKEPELSLSSEPPYSPEKLMVMLSTGKSWQGVEDSLATGTLSADLTKDFIDYFFFAGKANMFARKFGVKEFTVVLDQDTQGVEAKKNLTDKLEVGYGLERKDTPAGEGAVSQQIQAGYQLTDELSVGVKKEVIKTTTDALLNEPSTETKSKEGVYLEYKKSF
ncbi:MAG TPA: translocation/assembly module TamB domain-containing protein, partial [Candidatus Omnitrophota bacterium]|nr:translocation/assembly module TamB domain-containing protein [Candidatus Omnitrophota bacterium]